MTENESSLSAKKLTEGKPLKAIASFSLPYMLAYFLQILYGLADLFFIGMYCDVAATTAVSNGAQVMHFITVVLIGLAMGTTVHIARATGANDKKRIANVAGNTFTIFLFLSIILCLVLLILRRQVVALIDVPEEAFEATVAYLVICFAGIPFIVIYNIISSIFRGVGDSKRPMYFVVVACIVNIILDFILIGLLGWGTIGAAVATVASQCAAVAISSIALTRHRNLVAISREDLRVKKRTLGALLRIGIPIALQDGFIQVSFLIIAVIANRLGLDKAAAVGIVEKFIGLLFIIPSAMLATVSTISAQCFGASKQGRAILTMKYCMVISTVFGCIWCILLQFFPQYAVGMFTDDAGVITLGSEYIQSYSWDCVFAGIHFCFSGFFTACGYSIISFIHNLISIAVARVPLSYLFAEISPDNLFPMGCAPGIGSILSIIICLVAYPFVKRKVV